MKKEKLWVEMTYKEKVDWMTEIVKFFFNDRTAAMVNELVTVVDRKYREQLVDFIIKLLIDGEATLETDNDYLNIMFANHVADVLQAMNRLMWKQKAEEAASELKVKS